MHQHLRDFGFTIYDLDFAHQIPADDPAPVLDTFKLYLRGQGADPYARQHEAAQRREQAVQAVEQRLRGLRLRWFTGCLVFAQKFAPLREDGLAEIGLAYPLIRRMLLELGDRLARGQAIAVAGDIFWLTQDEVQLLAARVDAGELVETHSEKISQRRASHRAALRAAPPRILPQIKLFGFDLLPLKAINRRGHTNVIRGVAASPGRTAGVARILQGPEDFVRLKPGEVLVAPITTPAWTPLFAMASAIVTDVGGPLSHGSIVAREYGIPAVLGTGVATRRIRDGQTITVDGSVGRVTLETDF
jgi:pyruvate,water dikinase